MSGGLALRRQHPVSQQPLTVRPTTRVPATHSLFAHCAGLLHVAVSLLWEAAPDHRRDAAAAAAAAAADGIDDDASSDGWV
jgi:hypothetical protein